MNTIYYIVAEALDRKRDLIGAKGKLLKDLKALATLENGWSSSKKEKKTITSWSIKMKHNMFHKNLLISLVIIIFFCSALETLLNSTSFFIFVLMFFFVSKLKKE